MLARVTQYRVRPGKLEDFTAAAEALAPALDKLAGFRVLLILRNADPASREVTSISVWETAADLRNSENDAFYYHVVAGLMGCCESFSPMREQEVVMSKFANP